MPKAIRKVRSKHYSQVIEVNVPMRFYWHEKGFDGVSLNFSSTPTPLSSGQERLCNEIFNALGPAIIDSGKTAGFIIEREARKTRIPRAFRDAFIEPRGYN